ncbi:MAG: SGNH/GDSL hydrolase family protein [Myxococcota bacterium]|nr:SGNH/GDSL hydrolase family protein [Myxococcota bacterium]MEC8382213.1 SGNH/GDSL hydrolase family protein [Myxococcota bacterium]
MNVTRQICYSLTVTLLIALFLEVVTRTVWSPPNWADALDVGTQLIPHPTRIWALEPGTHTQFGVEVSIDENGLRTGLNDTSEPAWLVLGDSSFFGHGLADADTLHAQLSTQLNQIGIERGVRCAGVPGYSILQSRILLDELGWDLNPEILVIGNLWSDNNIDHFVDAKWLDALHKPTAQMISTFRRSHLFLWLWAQLRPAGFEERKGDPQAKISWLRDPNASGQRRVAVEDYASALDQVLAEAGRRGVGVVLIQPANVYRVDQSVDEATWDPYFFAMAEVGRHRDVPVLDAAAYFRAFGLSSQNGFIDELHPSGLGNQYIAQGVLLQLQASGWPAERPIPNQKPPIEQTWQDPWADGVDFEANTGGGTP